MNDVLNLLLQIGLIFTAFFIILWGVNRLLLYVKRMSGT